MDQSLHNEFQSTPFQKEPPLQCVKQYEMDVITTKVEKFLHKETQCI